MKDIIYINGEFVAKRDAKISVFDHAFQFGDGIFEGLRFYQRNIFRLKQHLERLESSARILMIKMPWSQEALTEIIVESCRRNELTDGYIRMMVTRGEGTIGLNPFLCTAPGLVVIATTIQLYPESFYQSGLPIITASTRRNAPDALSGRIKSLNYLNNIMAKMEAVQAGVQEAIMLDRNGFIVECTGDNFFIVKGGVLTTPPTYQGALRGITRDAVLEIAKNLDVPTREEPMTLYEAYDADEVFLTGSAAEIVPVSTIDGRPIGSGAGKITRQLLAEFRKITATDGQKF
ncbi:branched-chain-amino-acid transaminase [Candidatus Sumerlaeota bacterium]|nr:branched-chain-amino-acid transaminase [Candidatus Sumerlaeota bacterium]